MKAHSNVALSLLIATSCCCSSLSLFCADRTQPLNRQKRLELIYSVSELREKKILSIDEHQKIADISKTLKDAETNLLAKNPTQIWRNEKIRQWHACELKAQNNIILEKLKNPTNTREEKEAYLNEKHTIVHNLKLIYEEEKTANPSNTEAENQALEFMAQSLVLGQLTSLTQPEIETTSTQSSSTKSETTIAPTKKQTENCIIL